jgi:DNA-binding NarL/FixJ family response regulator
MSDPLRVVLVDDHDLFRSGLRELLAEHGGIEVVGEGGDGAEAVALAARLRPDVVVMDLNMPRMSGVEATQRLTASTPDVRVLALTISAEDRTVIDAIRAGAYGYVLKDAPVEEVYRAIQAVAAGQLLVSPRVTRALVGVVGDFADRSLLATRLRSTLTERELEVLRLIALGRGNGEIAKELYLSLATVKNHVANILSKLGVENRVEAAAAAVRAQLV